MFALDAAARMAHAGDRMAERVGDFLVRIGAMTPEQVREILMAQQTGDRRLFGEIALERGYIGDDAIRRYVEYLEKQ